MSTRQLYEAAPRRWSLDTMDVERYLRDCAAVESVKVGTATVWRLRGGRRP